MGQPRPDSSVLFAEEAKLFCEVCLLSLLFFFGGASPAAHGSSQARSPLGAAAAGLHHSHSNAGSEPHLGPTPQLVALPDP